LSEPTILLMAPALNEADSASGLEALLRVNLPKATKYVVTVGKFDARKLVNTFNIESGYPAEPTCLQTLASWAGVPHLEDSRFRDGYDLFCLRSILAKSGSYDYAILLRDAGSTEQDWAELAQKMEDRLFLALSIPAAAAAGARASMMFNLADERSAGFLDLAWELYVTGTVYGLSPYSFDQALDIATDAQRIERQI
jgi:hypothetical protein